jgi:PAS domain S-box-containing protein
VPGAEERDVAKLRESLERIEQRARLADALNEVDSAIGSRLGLDEVLSRVVALAGTALGADQTAVALLDGDGWVVRQMDGPPNELLGAKMDHEAYPLGIAALETRAPVAVPDTTADPRVDPDLAARLGLRAALAIPLLDRGRAAGALFFSYYGGPREFTPAELEFGDRLGTSVSIALENARLFEAEQESARLTAALAEVETFIHSSLEFDEITERALAAAAQAIAADTGAIIGRDRDGWLTLQSYNFDPPVTGVRLTDEENPHGAEALATGRTIVVEDAFTDPSVDNEFMKAYGLRSVIVAPLIVRGIPEAGLYFNFTESIHGFTEAECEFVTRVASSVSLAMENARLFAELRESSDRVSTILESIGDAFFALDHEWRFTYVNPEAERLLDAKAEDLLGNGIWDIFAEAVGTEYYTEYHRVMEDGVTASFEAYYPALKLWTEVRAYPSDGGISVYFRDIGNRKAADETLRETRARADTLAMLLDDSSQPFMVGRPDSRFVLWNRAYEQLTGYTGEELREMRWPDDVTEPESLKLEKAIVAEMALDGEPRRYEKAFLRKDGTLVQTEALRHVQRDENGDPEYYYAFFTDVTERKQAAAELEAERERLRQILEEIPLGVSLTDASGRVLEVNNASKAIWATDHAAESTADYKRFKGMDLGTGKRLGPDDWPPVVAIRTGLPVSQVIDIERFDGTRAAAHISAVPIADAKGQLARVITITRDVTRELEAQRLTDALNSIGAAVAATLDFDEILHRVFQLSADALEVDGGALAVKRGEDWAVPESLGPDGAIGSDRLRQHRAGLAMLAAAEHGPVVIGDVHDDPRLESSILPELGIRSVMAVPIAVQRSAVAALIFEHGASRGPFTPEQVDFAAKLMVIVTLALENARLYERERLIADTLQEAVLTPPEDIPGVKTAYFYRPASTSANVGGDFYDVFAIDDEHVALAIGDISGKGLDAARLTSLVHDGIRAYAYEDLDPGSVLSRVNRLVLHSSSSEVFATAFFAVLEPATGVLRYCTAGHPPPAVIGPEGPSLLEGSRSAVVGVLPDAVYDVGETILAPGEVLVMYTDGVTEARRDRQLFGEQRVLEALRKIGGAPVADVPDALLAEVLLFARGHLNDDTVILAAGLG